MSVGSPTAFLLWAILACLFFGFLIVHLWCYDGFKCLRWNSGRQPGAFKRIMTYSYLATLPLLVCFSVAITYLKFKEGYLEVPLVGISMPRPMSLWEEHNRRWVIPLCFVFSIGWSLEIVTHLEELFFWIFLLNQARGQREWFQSWEFRLWCLGSILSVFGMPLITLITRYDLESCIAWIFVAGASASTVTTLFFFSVIFRFPGFICFVKSGGADAKVVIRLLTFYQLNLARVVFRFFFTIPILVLGIDGVQGRHQIVLNPFAADFLIMLAAVGSFVSSAITLFIFFPRSIATECGYRSLEPVHLVQEKGSVGSFETQSSFDDERSFSRQSDFSEEETPTTGQNPLDFDAVPAYNAAQAYSWDVAVHDVTLDPQRVIKPSYYTTPQLQTRHRQSGMPTPGTPSHGTSTTPVILHPYVMTFTSPIDLLDASEVPTTHTI